MCRCFAKVYVNMTIYRSFARASIHVNVDDMTGQCVKQCQVVEQHIRNCEHDLVEQWHLLAHVVG